MRRAPRTTAITISLFVVGLLLFVTGCKVGRPGSLETEMMNKLKRKITIGGKGVPNPLQATEENIKEGQEHFGHHCAICHGLDGQNTGVPFADHMAPPVPALTSSDVQKYEDGQLKWIVENGINPSGMPSWRGILDEDEMWKVALYIRHLPAKGSLGVPAVYKEEEEEHEHMHMTEGTKSKSAPAHEHTHSHPQ